MHNLKKKISKGNKSIKQNKQMLNKHVIQFNLLYNYYFN